MATDLQVANQALRHLAMPPIESLASNSSSISRVVKDALDSSIRSVMGLYNWTPNRLSEESTGTEIEPEDGKWNYQHDLTALAQTIDSMVSVRRGDGTYTHNFQRVGDTLEIDEEKITITYTYVVDTVVGMPEYLANLIAAHLAKEGCMVLTGDGNKYYAMDRIYQEALRRARSQELKMNPHGLENINGCSSSFIAAHQGY